MKPNKFNLITYVSTIVGAVTIGLGSLCESAAAEFEAEALWETPATFSYIHCLDCTDDRLVLQKRVEWGNPEIRRQMISPTAKVRFGPFRLKRTAIWHEPSDEPAATVFRISVWARSPSIYVDGTFRGANPDLIEIGSVVESLTGATAEKDVYVSVTLPSIFTAIQLRGRIGGVGDPVHASFPEDCSSLPSSDGGLALDLGCMQAVVNPLAVLKMKWMPIAILYEPPGSCSWANLTSEHILGCSIAAAETRSTSINTISDSGFFWDAKHTDITSEMVSGTSRFTEVRVTFGDIIGTRLGLPLGNEGDPRCNMPGIDVPERTDSGPGRGDVFVLLKDPSMLYWNTANLTASTFSPVTLDGLGEHVVTRTAHQIRNGTEFTEEEKNAILALDPFVNMPTGIPLKLPDRFISLDKVIDLGPGIGFQHLQGRDVRVGDGRTLTEVIKEKTSSTSSDLPVVLSSKAISYGGSAAATAAAKKVANEILGSGFKALTDKIAIVVPEFYKEQTETTITTSYSRNNLIDRASDTATTQQFFLQDTHHGVSVALYYDSLFGTYAFVEHPSGAGEVLSAEFRNLPVYVLRSVDPMLQPGLADLPDAMQASLRQLGPVSLHAALGSEFRPAWGPYGAIQQTLFFAQDANGNRLAQVWVCPAPPTIITQPISTVTTSGSNAILSVVATGTPPLNFQWRVNGLDIPGATSSTYTIVNAQPNHIGLYSVVVSSTAGLVVSQGATVSVASGFPVEEGLVAHYRFDDGLRDSSGHGNNGVANRNPVFVDDLELGSKALVLDGSTVVSCGTNSSLNLTRNLTIACWMKPEFVSCYQYYYDPVGKDGSWMFRLRKSGQETYVWLDLPGTSGNDTLAWNRRIPTFQINQWIHVVLTYDGERKAIYLNGRFAYATAAGGEIVSTNGELRLGGDLSRSSGCQPELEYFPFHGSLADVRIYNRVIEPREILTIAEKNLVAYWNFDEANGAPALDLSPVGHHTAQLKDGAGRAESKPGLNQALALDGTDDYAEFSPTATGQSTTELTVALWINPRLPFSSTMGPLVANLLGNPENAIAIDSTGKRLEVRLATEAAPTPAVFVFDATVPEGVWTHVAVVYGQSAVTCYVNGRSQGSVPLSGQMRTGTVPGWLGAATGARFSGQMDEVRIYSRALSVGEISLLTEPGEVHVSPSGRREGWGTPEDPIDLNTALCDQLLIRPGTTVWLHGGSYNGPFPKDEAVSPIAGIPGNAVTYRVIPGERATLTLSRPVDAPPGWTAPADILRVKGHDVCWWGMEVTSPDTNCQPPGAGNAVHLVNTDGVKLINLVIHDNSGRNGIGAYRTGRDQEISGCLIYRNGGGANRGHGIYAQNTSAAEPKRFRDCLVFDNYDHGIHAYSAQSTFLSGFKFQGVAAWGNGPYDGNAEANLLAGTDGTAISDLELRQCFTYYPIREGQNASVRLGYQDNAANGRLTVDGCVFVGGKYATWLSRWNRVRFTRNRLFTPHDAALNVDWLPGQSWTNGWVDYNQYHSVDTNASVWRDATTSASYSDLTGWRQITGGWDLHSSLAPHAPDQSWVFFRPNPYDPNRAHLIVYNWQDDLGAVVDFGALWDMQPGDSFTVASADDVWGQPILTGVHSGEPVLVPLPKSGRNVPPGKRAAEFAVFAIERKTQVSETATAPRDIFARLDRATCTVQLAWTSPQPYASLEVFVDGQLVKAIAPSAQAVEVQLPSCEGEHVVTLVGKTIAGVNFNVDAYQVVLPPPTPPRLTIVRDPASGLLQISWPRPAEGFVLESAGELTGAPGSWAPVAPPYQTNATHVQVTESAPIENRFYRLRRP